MQTQTEYVSLRFSQSDRALIDHALIDCTLTVHSVSPPPNSELQVTTSKTKSSATAAEVSSFSQHLLVTPFYIPGEYHPLYYYKCLCITLHM